MNPLINYHYTLPFKEVNSFLFLPYGVDETCYKDRILPQIPRIVDTLNKFRESRQAAISVNNNINNSCMMGLGFQIVKNKLIVCVTMRSQCKTNGRPSDTVMIQYISTLVMKALGLKQYKVYVTVWNYHNNVELTKENDSNEEVQRNIKLLVSS